jgi:hypothetical protein
MTPPHIPDVCMDRLLVFEFPERTFQGQSREKATLEPLAGWFVLGDDGSRRAASGVEVEGHMAALALSLGGESRAS